MSHYLLAQVTKLESNLRLSISEGLAHNGVTSILEHSKGRMWFGTYDGISIYDGYELNTIKNTLHENVLSSNRVRALAEDKNGNVWIGTDAGVTIYDHKSQKFKNIDINLPKEQGLGQAIIRDIIFTENGFALCLTEGSGLLVFDNNYTFVGNYMPNNIVNPENILFFNGIALDASNYLFSSSMGLFHFRTDNFQFNKVLENDIQGTYYIESLGNGKILFSASRGVSIVTFSNTGDKYQFKLGKSIYKKYQIICMMIDNYDNLWLGTKNKGVVKIENFKTLLLKNNLHEKLFDDGLDVLRTSALISTSTNHCWLTTFNEGVYRFDIKKSPFNSFNTSMDLKYGLSSNISSHISNLNDNEFYITSPYGGLALFNVKNQSFEELRSELLRKNKHLIKSIFVDSKKNLWFGLISSRDLYRLKKGSNKFEKVFFAKDAMKDNFYGYSTITEDNLGNIWLAGNSAYRIKVDKQNNIETIEEVNQNTFFKDKSLGKIRFIYADPLYDLVWIGSESKGLFRIKADVNLPVKDLEIENYTRDVNRQNSISSNFVSTIIRLPNNELWIGTEGGGICKVVDGHNKPKFFALSEKDGLSNNVVKSILYDDEYNLWISTNIGLNKFNTKTSSFRKFNKSDGLPFEDFWYPAQRFKNGVMVFSGLDGFCYFSSNRIIEKEQMPNLEFENFKLFNKTITPGDTVNNRVLFDKRIDDKNEIILKYDENVFSLDIVSLHFLNTENHFLKYKLLPLNEEWIQVTSNNNTINYNGLQPGAYELNVMASNALNEWTPPKKLKILITAPYWRTPIAYIVYVILLVLLIYIISRVVLKIQRLSHEVEIEQMEINNVKEVNEAKLRFFSNISHEIKTPLTLLSGPTNILLERFKGNTEISSKLSLMQRQSKKIYQLIEQVQDFRRADVGALRMDYMRFSFNSFIQEISQDFKILASNDNKEMKIEGENKVIIVSADKDKLEKIFNNLLNNAFKYTKTNDTIEVKFKTDDKDLIVEVIDTGRGIDAKDIGHIFERFYQSHKPENKHVSGSGIGLAFSKRLVEMHYGFISAESIINEGTKITVRLPIVKELLDKEVIKDINLPKEKEVLVDNHLFDKDSINNLKTSNDFSESLIFYAEDNSDMRAFVTDVLSKFFKVKCFRNGQECYDAFDEEWPDIIISDIQMPELNGLDLCVRIKSDLKTSHIPVILLTALANLEDHIKGLRDGADAYIKKPFNFQHLVTNVEALLNNRKQLRERYKIGIPLTKENNRNNRNDNAFLEKLYSLIEENMEDQDFDLNRLSRELYLNRTHFYQKVKTLTNQTPLELLRNYRLKKAAELLVNESLSINEVIPKVGLKNRTHFAKIFKDKYGVTASAYVSEMHKKYL
ncbi:hybrid sensor histidine kinase/response regulator transcription factor [Flavivirga algicola]|uniref:histidine kinase n=1 Tax=Flavivirga algicola TaxID=2729136 RepID=A0ABX1RVR8_9FLAO|nr:hybrid sensor histidine kinase/response regulator transcription factor [Flavivirga algicola]NMH86863.1 response regulator [Flavivirga algicola]